MAATPVDDHTAEFEQLAGLSALDALDCDEREQFKHHAARCERCRLILRLDREALRSLPLAVPEMDPSPDFKARLMRRAASELAPPAKQVPREPILLRPPPNVVPLWRRSPWTSALAALLVLGLVSFGGISYANQPVLTVELHGDAPGSAQVVVRRRGSAELVMQGVPDPGPGFVYEAWVIPSTPGSLPIAAGTSATGTGTVPLERDPRGATVAITKERGRADAPTSPILLSGPLQS